VFDGRYANNGWLQELPRPIEKLTWDNAVLVSRGTAKALGVWNGDVVTLEVDGRSVEGPIWVQPGHAENCATVFLGYGRRLPAEYEVAANTGFDVYPLRTASSPSFVRGGKATRTGRTYQLVSTQDHGALEGRPLVRETTLTDFRAKPEWSAKDLSPLAKAAALTGTSEQKLLRSLWDERDYTEGYQWGMTIDLNSCTGCGACVVACVSENNIPVVGKQQVASGREMHWVRVDRYFGGVDGEAEQDGVSKDDEPAVVHQVVPCMQCENAPCESVCPVAATVHSPEGLNDMAYNRCIGTRYCSNNCPYKVRRFNWFNFNKNVPPSRQLAFNPDVTVRARGVMEKCTYCVQRINAGKFQAKSEGRRIRDGEIVTACQQACPAEAIAFGDIRDADSRVSKLKTSDLNYAMLSEYNLKPRTTYLAKVRNPNSELS
jgi:molybdopterin-containing oxidoreductase family iron-sulfur binding subunit